jgi:hypothetical protein
MRLTSRANPIKKLVNLLALFGKLDHLREIRTIMYFSEMVWLTKTSE